MVKKLVLIFTACVCGAGSAQAGTAGTTIPVSASVPPTCTVVATALNFGNYTQAQLDASNTITSTCTTGTSFSLALDSGIGVNATTTVRKLSSGFNLLSYTLYSDSSRSTTWGNNIGSDTVALTAGGSALVNTIYGRVFGGQNVPSGSYADTVSVTLTY